MRMPKGLAVLCGSLAALAGIASCADSPSPTAPVESERIGTTSQALMSAAWTSAVSMSTARQNHVAALLQNGSVLVAGGHPGNNVPTSSAEVFNPATGAWTTVGSMGSARRLFGACTLSIGKVLVAGGNAGAGDVTSAELFDPSTSTWSATGSLAAAREDFSMTCLSDGRVLVAGGSGPSGVLSGAEVYDATAGTWSSAGTLPAAVHTQGAVLLSDGRVLIAGGNNAAGPVSTAAIWNPTTNAWTATGSMSTARAFYALDLLSDGRVLAAGGLVNVLGGNTNTAEIYSPTAGTWSAAARLNTARYSGVSATLAAGPTVVGGVNGGSPLASSESYDSVRNTWTQVSTAYGAVNQTATALSSSSVLVAGGNTGSQATKSAQTYGVLNTFAVYAQRSVTLGSTDHINGGDLGVAATAPASFGTQLVVGLSSTVQSNHNIVAPSVSLGSGAQVGDVQTNSLTNSGATLGTQAAYPSPMPAPSLALPAGPGGSNVTVPAFTITTLNPGNFGAVSVTGTLYLNPGSYTFSSVTMADQAHLAGVSGTATVSVAGSFQAGNSVSISSPGGTPAGQLFISVAGYDSGTTPVFHTGTSAAISAILSAPRGTLSIGANTLATGALAGFDVKLGNGVTINFQNGFAGSAASQHGTQQLSGYITSAMAAAPLVGPVPGNTLLHLAVGLPLRNQAGLQTFITNLSDPTSSQYRQYLSPSNFAATYGPLPATSQALTNALAAAGLTVTTTYTSNQLFGVTGTAAAVESIFFTNLNYYQRADGTQFYAPDREPSITLDPATATILRVDGLDSFAVPKTLDGSGPIPTIPPEQQSFGLTGVHMYLGSDFRNAYAPYTSATGAGQSVALVEFEGFYPVDVSDYTNLQSYKDMLSSLNLASAPQVTPVLLDNFDGNPTSNAYTEVTLDIDMAIAMAPGLDHVYVYEEPNSTTNSEVSYNAAAAQELSAIANPGPGISLSRQISCSWYDFGGANVAVAVLQFAADGQSYFMASGDLGSYSSDNNPATPPYTESEANFMTMVGGTQLTTNSGQQWSSEALWFDGLPGFQGIRALGGVSGGGIMTGVPIPWYQSPISSQIVTAGGDKNWRNIPDVALTATDIGFMASPGPGCDNTICVPREILFTGGTSAAAPLWAGFMALANEGSAVSGGGAIGFANPAIYQIGQGSDYGSDFHDIVGGQSGIFSPHFRVIVGYDLGTGWGTPGGTLAATTTLLGDLAASVPNSYSSVSVGGEFACGITTTNGLECWGRNDFGQLGNTESGLLVHSDLPQQMSFGIGSIPDVREVATGDSFACAVLSFGGGNPFGDVYCWGDNSDGECGINVVPGGSQPSPVLVGDVWGPSGAAGLSAGYHFACALSGSGTASRAWCWGDDSHGELGPNATGTTATATDMGLNNVVRVSAGNGFACAIQGDGSVSCWGDNSSGQLGTGSFGSGGSTPTEVDFPLLPRSAQATDIAAGDGFACATMLVPNVDWEVWCWGDNSLGELGDNAAEAKSATPVKVVDLSTSSATQVAVGGKSVCASAIGTNNNAACWGSNSNGQLGFAGGSGVFSAIPVLMPGVGQQLVPPGVGIDSMCTMTTGAVPVCWGSNEFGQLGDNSTADSVNPVPIEASIQ